MGFYTDLEEIEHVAEAARAVGRAWVHNTQQATITLSTYTVKMLCHWAERGFDAAGDPHASWLSTIDEVKMRRVKEAASVGATTVKPKQVDKRRRSRHS